jgi:adenylate cyclase
VDEKEFIDAGIYDPASPHAADRLQLIEWMVERGVTLEQMVERGNRSLSGLAGDLALRPGRRVSARDIAEQTGIPVEKVLALALAAGFPPPGPDAPSFTEADIQVFVTFSAGASLFGEAATQRFTRVVGSSLSRIAEAAVTLFQVNVEQPILESGGSELSIAQKNLSAIETLGSVRVLLDSLFGSHVETAIRRLREARPTRSPDSVQFAVGFVDLVGFTTVTQRMAVRDLALLVEHFEEACYDVVAAFDGRVVKLIGDEVMFVTRDRGDACRIALTLFERFAADRSVTPRGAIAYGEMLVRGGDYYGPIVNLAARIAQVAVPSELLVTAEVASEVAAADLDFEPAGRRMLKGFDEPVSLLTVSRKLAAGDILTTNEVPR